MFKVFFFIIISSLSLQTMAEPVIVVLGDSISASHGMPVEQGWVSLLQKKLLTHHSRYTFYNASISGETSAGGLARIDSLLNTQKPAIVLLQLGANDGLRGLSPVDMKSNLEEITRRAQNIGATVLLLSMKIPPNYGKRYVDLFYNVYPQLAQQLNITLVPFLLEDVALHKDLMQADGLHPNARAQAILADKIEPYLLPLLK
jgi:acyl-CoA thioesterase-1